MKKTLILLAVLFLSLAASAGASPEKAAALKELLSRRLAESAVSGDALRVERTPDVSVTEKAGLYHLRIPQLRLISKDGWLVEAPLVEGDATPQPDGSWQVQLHLAQGLAVYGANSFRLGEVTLARQNLTLGLSADGRSLLSADLDFGDVKFTPVLGAGRGSLTALRLILTPKALKEGFWSGRLSLSIDGLSLKDTMGSDRLALARLRLDGAADGLDMRRMGLLLADGDRAHLDRLARAVSLSAEIAGLNQVRDDGGRTRLAAGKGRAVLTGLSGSKAALALNWAHDGLDHVAPGTPAGLLPVRAEVTLDAGSLPRALLTGAKPADGWTSALAAAGATIKLSRLTLLNPQSTVLAQGDFRFANANVAGVAGEANVSLRGIDRLITGINQSLGTKGAVLSIGLYALQGLGRVEPGPLATTHQYVLSIAPTGQTTLNNSNATSLFRGLMAVL